VTRSGAAGGHAPANDDERSAAAPLVVIGASWGGLHAVSTILAGLPPAFDTPVAIVQHRAKESDGLLVGLLQATTSLQVCDVEDKETIRAGHVYIAPPDYHLLVDDGHFSLSLDAAVRYSRPSIDVALASAADSCGAAAVGVLLTGANDDGARGLRRIVDRGGRALVQDPATAEVRTMPEAGLRALADAPRDRWAVVPLTEIAARIAALAGSPYTPATPHAAHAPHAAFHATPPAGRTVR
jgi:two-component system chemotaxis response regulator CheB